MNKKHDGWVVKSCYGKTPSLMFWTFSLRRNGAIRNWGAGWETGRKKGWLKVVKVKLVEVM